MKLRDIPPHVQSIWVRTDNPLPSDTDFKTPILIENGHYYEVLGMLSPPPPVIEKLRQVGTWELRVAIKATREELEKLPPIAVTLYTPLSVK